MKRNGMVLIIGLLGAANAAGQIVDCQHEQVTSPKVLLDGVKVLAEGTGPRLRQFQDRVRRRLWMRLNALPALLASEGGVNLVECRERIPGGPGDFTTAIEERMLDGGVLLEFWARVDSTSTDEDKPAFEAQVQWMSFPISRSKEMTPANRGFFSMPQRMSLNESTRSVDSLLTPQYLLAAHVLLGLATSDLSNGEYTNAYRRLCLARAQLSANDLTFRNTLESWMRLTANRARSAGRPIVGTDLAGSEGGEP
jgi:hypothetical protein